MEEIELELVHDDKYGELLKFDVIDVDPKRPTIVAIIRYKDIDYLAIHKGYIKGDQLTYGKGIRIPIDDGQAEMVLLAAQGLTLGQDLELE